MHGGRTSRPRRDQKQHSNLTSGSSTATSTQHTPKHRLRSKSPKRALINDSSEISPSLSTQQPITSPAQRPILPKLSSTNIESSNSLTSQNAIKTGQNGRRGDKSTPSTSKSLSKPSNKPLKPTKPKISQVNNPNSITRALNTTIQNNNNNNNNHNHNNGIPSSQSLSFRPPTTTTTTIYLSRYHTTTTPSLIFTSMRQFATSANSPNNPRSARRSTLRGRTTANNRGPTRGEQNHDSSDDDDDDDDGDDDENDTDDSYPTTPNTRTNTPHSNTRMPTQIDDTNTKDADPVGHVDFGPESSSSHSQSLDQQRRKRKSTSPQAQNVQHIPRQPNNNNNDGNDDDSYEQNNNDDHYSNNNINNNDNDDLLDQQDDEEEQKHQLPLEPTIAAIFPTALTSRSFPIRTPIHHKYRIINEHFYHRNNNNNQSDDFEENDSNENFFDENRKLYSKKPLPKNQFELIQQAIRDYDDPATADVLQRFDVLKGRYDRELARRKAQSLRQQQKMKNHQQHSTNNQKSTNQTTSRRTARSTQQLVEAFQDIWANVEIGSQPPQPLSATPEQLLVSPQFDPDLPFSSTVRHTITSTPFVSLNDYPIIGELGKIQVTNVWCLGQIGALDQTLEIFDITCSALNRPPHGPNPTLPPNHPSQHLLPARDEFIESLLRYNQAYTQHLNPSPTTTTTTTTSSSSATPNQPQPYQIQLPSHWIQSVFRAIHTTVPSTGFDDQFHRWNANPPISDEITLLHHKLPTLPKNPPPISSTTHTGGLEMRFQAQVDSSHVLMPGQQTLQHLLKIKPNTIIVKGQYDGHDAVLFFECALPLVFDIIAHTHPRDLIMDQSQFMGAIYISSDTSLHIDQDGKVVSKALTRAQKLKKRINAKVEEALEQSRKHDLTVPMTHIEVKRRREKLQWEIEQEENEKQKRRDKKKLEKMKSDGNVSKDHGSSGSDDDASDNDSDDSSGDDSSDVDYAKEYTKRKLRNQQNRRKSVTSTKNTKNLSGKYDPTATKYDNDPLLDTDDDDGNDSDDPDGTKGGKLTQFMNVILPSTQKYNILIQPPLLHLKYFLKQSENDQYGNALVSPTRTIANNRISTIEKRRNAMNNTSITSTTTDLVQYLQPKTNFVLVQDYHSAKHNNASIYSLYRYYWTPMALIPGDDDDEGDNDDDGEDTSIDGVDGDDDDDQYEEFLDENGTLIRIAKPQPDPQNKRKKQKSNKKNQKQKDSNKPNEIQFLKFGSFNPYLRDRRLYPLSSGIFESLRQENSNFVLITNSMDQTNDQRKIDPADTTQSPLNRSSLTHLGPDGHQSTNFADSKHLFNHYSKGYTAHFTRADLVKLMPPAQIDQNGSKNNKKSGSSDDSDGDEIATPLNGDPESAELTWEEQMEVMQGKIQLSKNLISVFTSDLPYRHSDYVLHQQRFSTFAYTIAWPSVLEALLQEISPVTDDLTSLLHTNTKIKSLKYHLSDQDIAALQHEKWGSDIPGHVHHISLVSRTGVENSDGIDQSQVSKSVTVLTWIMLLDSDTQQLSPLFEMSNTYQIPKASLPPVLVEPKEILVGGKSNLQYRKEPHNNGGDSTDRGGLKLKWIPAGKQQQQQQKGQQQQQQRQLQGGKNNQKNQITSLYAATLDDLPPPPPQTYYLPTSSLSKQTLPHIPKPDQYLPQRRDRFGAMFHADVTQIHPTELVRPDKDAEISIVTDLHTYQFNSLQTHQVSDYIQFLHESHASKRHYKFPAITFSFPEQENIGIYNSLVGDFSAIYHNSPLAQLHFKSTPDQFNNYDSANREIENYHVNMSNTNHHQSRNKQIAPLYNTKFNAKTTSYFPHIDIIRKLYILNAVDFGKHIDEYDANTTYPTPPDSDQSSQQQQSQQSFTQSKQPPPPMEYTKYITLGALAPLDAIVTKLDAPPQQLLDQVNFTFSPNPLHPDAWSSLNTHTPIIPSSRTELLYPSRVVDLAPEEWGHGGSGDIDRGDGKLTKKQHSHDSSNKNDQTSSKQQQQQRPPLPEFTRHPDALNIEIPQTFVPPIMLQQLLSSLLTDYKNQNAQLLVDFAKKMVHSHLINYHKVTNPSFDENDHTKPPPLSPFLELFDLNMTQSHIFNEDFEILRPLLPGSNLVCQLDQVSPDFDRGFTPEDPYLYINIKTAVYVHSIDFKITSRDPSTPTDPHADYVSQPYRYYYDYQSREDIEKRLQVATGHIQVAYPLCPKKGVLQHVILKRLAYIRRAIQSFETVRASQEQRTDIYSKKNITAQHSAKLASMTQYQPKSALVFNGTKLFGTAHEEMLRDKIMGAMVGANNGIWSQLYLPIEVLEGLALEQYFNGQRSEIKREKQRGRLNLLRGIGNGGGSTAGTSSIDVDTTPFNNSPPQSTSTGVRQLFLRPSLPASSQSVIDVQSTSTTPPPHQHPTPTPNTPLPQDPIFPHELTPQGKLSMMSDFLLQSSRYLSNAIYDQSLRSLYTSMNIDFHTIITENPPYTVVNFTQPMIRFKWIALLLESLGLDVNKLVELIWTREGLVGGEISSHVLLDLLRQEVSVLYPYSHSSKATWHYLSTLLDPSQTYFIMYGPGSYQIVDDRPGYGQGGAAGAGGGGGEGGDVEEGNRGGPGDDPMAISTAPPTKHSPPIPPKQGKHYNDGGIDHEDSYAEDSDMHHHDEGFIDIEATTSATIISTAPTTTKRPTPHPTKPLSMTDHPKNLSLPQTIISEAETTTISTTPLTEKEMEKMFKEMDLDIAQEPEVFTSGDPNGPAETPDPHQPQPKAPSHHQSKSQQPLKHHHQSSTASSTSATGTTSPKLTPLSPHPTPSDDPYHHNDDHDFQDVPGTPLPLETMGVVVQTQPAFHHSDPHYDPNHPMGPHFLARLNRVPRKYRNPLEMFDYSDDEGYDLLEWEQFSEADHSDHPSGKKNDKAGGQKRRDKKFLAPHERWVMKPDGTPDKTKPLLSTKSGSKVKRQRYGSNNEDSSEENNQNSQYKNSNDDSNSDNNSDQDISSDLSGSDSELEMLYDQYKQRISDQRRKHRANLQLRQDFAHSSNQKNSDDSDSSDDNDDSDSDSDSDDTTSLSESNSDNDDDDRKLSRKSKTNPHYRPPARPNSNTIRPDSNIETIYLPNGASVRYHNNNVGVLALPQFQQVAAFIHHLATYAYQAENLLNSINTIGRDGDQGGGNKRRAKLNQNGLGNAPKPPQNTSFFTDFCDENQIPLSNFNEIFRDIRQIAQYERLNSVFLALHDNALRPPHFERLFDPNAPNFGPDGTNSAVDNATDEQQRTRIMKLQQPFAATDVYNYAYRDKTLIGGSGALGELSALAVLTLDFNGIIQQPYDVTKSAQLTRETLLLPRPEGKFQYGEDGSASGGDGESVGNTNTTEGGYRRTQPRSNQDGGSATSTGMTASFSAPATSTTNPSTSTQPSSASGKPIQYQATTRGPFGSEIEAKMNQKPTSQKVSNLAKHFYTNLNIPHTTRLIDPVAHAQQVNKAHRQGLPGSGHNLHYEHINQSDKSVNVQSKKKSSPPGDNKTQQNDQSVVGTQDDPSAPPAVRWNQPPVPYLDQLNWDLFHANDSVDLASITGPTPTTLPGQGSNDPNTNENTTNTINNLYRGTSPPTPDKLLFLHDHLSAEITSANESSIAQNIKKDIPLDTWLSLALSTAWVQSSLTPFVDHVPLFKQISFNPTQSRYFQSISRTKQYREWFQHSPYALDDVVDIVRTGNKGEGYVADGEHDDDHEKKQSQMLSTSTTNPTTPNRGDIFKLNQDPWAVGIKHLTDQLSFVVPYVLVLLTLQQTTKNLQVDLKSLPNHSPLSFNTLPLDNVGFKQALEMVLEDYRQFEMNNINQAENEIVNNQNNQQQRQKQQQQQQQQQRPRPKANPVDPSTDAVFKGLGINTRFCSFVAKQLAHFQNEGIPPQHFGVTELTDVVTNPTTKADQNVKKSESTSEFDLFSLPLLSDHRLQARDPNGLFLLDVSQCNTFGTNYTLSGSAPMVRVLNAILVDAERIAQNEKEQYLTALRASRRQDGDDGSDTPPPPPPPPPPSQQQSAIDIQSPTSRRHLIKSVRDSLGQMLQLGEHFDAKTGPDQPNLTLHDVHKLHKITSTIPNVYTPTNSRIYNKPFFSNVPEEWGYGASGDLPAFWGSNQQQNSEETNGAQQYYNIPASSPIIGSPIDLLGRKVETIIHSLEMQFLNISTHEGAVPAWEAIQQRLLLNSTGEHIQHLGGVNEAVGGLLLGNREGTHQSNIDRTSPVTHNQLDKKLLSTQIGAQLTQPSLWQGVQRRILQQNMGNIEFRFDQPPPQATSMGGSNTARTGRTGSTSTTATTRTSTLTTPQQQQSQTSRKNQIPKEVFHRGLKVNVLEFSTAPSTQQSTQPTAIAKRVQQSKRGSTDSDTDGSQSSFPFLSSSPPHRHHRHSSSLSIHNNANLIQLPTPPSVSSGSIIGGVVDYSQHLSRIHKTSLRLEDIQLPTTSGHYPSDMLWGDTNQPDNQFTNALYSTNNRLHNKPALNRRNNPGTATNPQHGSDAFLTANYLNNTFLDPNSTTKTWLGIYSLKMKQFKHLSLYDLDLRGLVPDPTVLQKQLYNMASEVREVSRFNTAAKQALQNLENEYNHQQQLQKDIVLLPDQVKNLITPKTLAKAKEHYRLLQLSPNNVFTPGNVAIEGKDALYALDPVLQVRDWGDLYSGLGTPSGPTT